LPQSDNPTRILANAATKLGVNAMHTRSVGLLSIALVLAHALPAAADPPRTDLHGDPLPDGAVGRLGTVRLRHGGPVHGLTFSPDGKVFASTGYDRVVRLWNAADGRPLGRLSDLHPNAILAFAPDGKTLAVASNDKVTLADVATVKPRLSLELFANCTALAFSADGKTLGTAAVQGGVLLEIEPPPGGLAEPENDDPRTRLCQWDVTTGKKLSDQSLPRCVPPTGPGRGRL
jgi:WD40 repeat protein